MGRLSSLFDTKRNEENRRLINGYFEEKAKRESLPKTEYRTNTGATSTAPSSYSPINAESSVTTTPAEPSLYAKYKSPLENKVTYGGIHDAPVSFVKPKCGRTIRKGILFVFRKIIMEEPNLLQTQTR